MYKDINAQNGPKVPTLNDRDADFKIIRWAPIFLAYMPRTYGSWGPLRYIIRSTAEVAPEAEYALEENYYFGVSGSLQEQLDSSLSHEGPIFKNENENENVCMKIEEGVHGTSIETTIKSFNWHKD